jgi:hypothetical protein
MGICPLKCRDSTIVDRLTFDAHIITTGTDSYRLRTTQARQAART